MLTVPQPNNGRKRTGFTLVEMLVVIAITAILFTLLLRPLVTTLRLTQRAQLLSAAQAAANTTLERITRELGSAVYVFDDNSHPFSGVAASAPNLNQRVDNFTNFLDLEITKQDGTYQITHAYNAKIDFVPARHTDTGLTDPTTGEPIQLKPGTGSATVSGTNLLFPLAPSSTIIRYFIGLKRPVDYSQAAGGAQGHYSNSNEGLAAASSQEDNTYILYTAQFSPYKTTTDAQGNKTVSVNTDLFRANAQGKPELDDPDFFRYVADSDIDWQDDQHRPYSATEGAAAHNARVENWVKIAKPVITQPDMDLLLLPHNADGSLAYDTSGTFNGVAHSGVALDPVTGDTFPIVNTSVTFRAALVSADAAPGSTTDYASLGVPANAADNGGVPYIPSLFTSSNKSWAYPYSLTLYQSNDPLTYTTSVYQDIAITGTNGLTTASGDILEYSNAGGSLTPVYDVTKGIVLKSAGAGGGTINNYVPLSINPDSGTINFATPALPAPANMALSTTYSPYQRFWSGDPSNINQGLLRATLDSTGTPAPGVVDLTHLYCDANGILSTSGGTNTSPLPHYGQPPTDYQCANAIIVPGSVRVYGPDSNLGPSNGSSVLYTQVSGGTELGVNQYRVDYVNKTITFNVSANAAGSVALPTTRTKPDGTIVSADPVLIAFDYQANLAGINSSLPITSDPNNPNLGRAYRVKIDYETRDLIDVNIGVRVYDPTDGHAVIIPVTQQVKIGNTNR